LSIYDGDTVTAVFYIKGDLKKYKVRICGIDTAEKKDPDPEICELAKHTMDAISPMHGKVVKAELGKFDKYGRVLSNIYLQTEEGEINLT
jgi:endonuclease YncB( thermonuclease family)